LSVYQFLKTGLLPGTLGLFFVLLAACLLLLWRRRGSRAALLCITAIVALYCAISMPVVAGALTRLVAGGYARQVAARKLSGVQAIVILDGGTSRTTANGIELAAPSGPSAVRAIEGLRIFRVLDGKPVMLVSGGDFTTAGRTQEGAAIREFLIANGVRPERVLLDTSSRNTREHAAHVPRILRANGVKSFALVTSAVHMRRSMRAFNTAGSRPIPAPAPLQPGSAGGWWPSTAGLDLSLEALHEVAGLLFGR
jgi:uncharacterized SAM-binding protein YcdF (DUF218 family)